MKFIAQDEAKCAKPCERDCYRKRPAHPDAVRQHYILPVFGKGGTCSAYWKDTDLKEKDHARRKRTT